MTIMQAQTFLGGVQNVELASLGRRTCETELELLELMDGTERERCRIGRRCSSCCAAVREFLEDDLVPTLEGRRRFHALVAANVLAIVERELQGEEEQLARQWDRLAALFALDRAARPQAVSALRAAVRELETRLAERIRAGEADGGELRRARPCPRPRRRWWRSSRSRTRGSAAE